MAQFKKWLDGEKDLFNQEIEPQPIDESKIKSIDNELLEASVSKKEKQLIVHTPDCSIHRDSRVGQ